MLGSLLVRNWVRHHLAAGRPGSPAADHSGKFSRCAASDKYADCFRRPEFLIALLSANRYLLVMRRELRSFSTLFLRKMADRYAGIFKQILPRLLFAETVAMNGLYVLGAKHDDRFRHQAHAVTPDGSQRK